MVEPQDLSAKQRVLLEQRQFTDAVLNVSRDIPLEQQRLAEARLTSFKSLKGELD